MGQLVNGRIKAMRLGTRPARNGLHHIIHTILLDRKLSARAPQYIFQSGLATVALLIMLLVEDVVLRAAIVVAVASSAFIIFVVPDSVAATPRKVIGGHFVAVIVGGIFFYALQLPIMSSYSEQSRLILDVAAALSVGLSIFAMVVTNTEHPPAAGTALGLVIHGFTWNAVAFILISALVLSLIRLILRPKLKSLL